MSEIEDLQKAVDSARYILEELREINSMKALAQLAGLPLAVVASKFDTIFNAEDGRIADQGESE